MNLNFLEDEKPKIIKKKEKDNTWLKVLVFWLLMVSAVYVGNMTSTITTFWLAKMEARETMKRMDENMKKAFKQIREEE